MRARLSWIDGLKGIACLGVFLTHFFGIFYLWVERSDLNLSPICVWLLDYPFKILINGNFMVALFCIISGYLVARKDIMSLKELFRAIVSRYLRLAVPVFGCCLYVFLSQTIVGFYNQEVGSFLNNTWLKGYYVNSINFREVIAISFWRLWLYSDSYINGPFWMMKSLFISSILILTAQYMLNRFPKIRVFLILAMGLVALKTPIYFGCISGMLFVNNLEAVHTAATTTGKRVIGNIGGEGRLHSGRFIYILLMVLSLTVVWIIPQWGGINEYLIVVCAWLCILAIMKLKFLQQILSLNVFLRLGGISFAIYGLHWPIMCSLGLKIFMYLYPSNSYTLAVAIDFIIVVLSTLGISFIYSKYVEKPCLIMMKKYL